MGQAGRNTADGGSALALADGALSQVSDISTRMSELATQAANGTLSDTQRQSLQQEFSQLREEAQRISATTEFNGTKLLDGSTTTIQVGTDSSSNSQIALTGVNASTSTIESLDISTQAGAQAALEAVKTFSQNVSQSRGSIGAVQSRLDSAANFIEDTRVRNAEAEARIRDADIAEEAANNVAARIRVQTSTALSAQANLHASTVLQLLR